MGATRRMRRGRCGCEPEGNDVRGGEIEAGGARRTRRGRCGCEGISVVVCDDEQVS
jgi:hypothetical protein